MSTKTMSEETQKATDHLKNSTPGQQWEKGEPESRLFKGLAAGLAAGVAASGASLSVMALGAGSPYALPALGVSVAAWIAVTHWAAKKASDLFEVAHDESNKKMHLMFGPTSKKKSLSLKNFKIDSLFVPPILAMAVTSNPLVLGGPQC